MENLLIVMPVKDSIETSLMAIEHVCSAKSNNPFVVYNDWSLPENKEMLQNKTTVGFTLVNLEDVVDTPSPNYRFVLIDAQKRALEQKAHLLLIESDVFVKEDTINRLLHFAGKLKNAGMVAALTTDANGAVNFPYNHIKPKSEAVIATKHRLSFCCTLLTNRLLKSLDFEELPKNKHWFDVTVTAMSRNAGFVNYILPGVKVVHQPHSSRPWKKRKYSNPLRYYFEKFIFGRDRI
ncbi:MAG: hypothetical protein K9H26_01975 [Prolixibacteraceae bacterium]|nr:hypothetical protein [Prolixibacteraceae bacterium]